MTDRLLDTQVVLWAALRPSRLPPLVAEMLADPTDRALVSSVSIAEMVIKQGIGKLDLPVDAVDLCSRMQFSSLQLTWAHAGAVGLLPSIHRDPFDRLLIAQAITEGLTMVTADRTVASYPGLTVLEVG